MASRVPEQTSLFPSKAKKKRNAKEKSSPGVKRRKKKEHERTLKFRVHTTHVVKPRWGETQPIGSDIRFHWLQLQATLEIDAHEGDTERMMIGYF